MTNKSRIAALLAITTTANNLASQSGITRLASGHLITIMKHARELRELVYTDRFLVSERADTEPVDETDVMEETDV